MLPYPKSMIQLYPDEPLASYEPVNGVLSVPCEIPTFGQSPAAGATVIPASSPFRHNHTIMQIFHNYIHVDQMFWIKYSYGWTPAVTWLSSGDPDFPWNYFRGLQLVTGNYAVLSPSENDWALSAIRYSTEPYGEILPTWPNGYPGTTANTVEKIELTSGTGAAGWKTVDNPFNGTSFEVNCNTTQADITITYYTGVWLSVMWIIYGQYRHAKRSLISILPVLPALFFLPLPFLFLLHPLGVSPTPINNNTGRRRRKEKN